MTPENSNEKIDDDLPAQEDKQDNVAEALKASPYPRLNELPEGEEPDLFVYLKSLPDAKIPPNYEGSPVEGNEEEAPEKTEEELKIEALAEKIRSRTRESQVTSLTLLLSEDSETPKILEMLSKDEAFKDIVHLEGQKDTYYYSDLTMTSQFANIAILIEEKDYLHTVAQMVRLHTKTYPAPTAESYFTSPPYRYPKAQMEQVRLMLKDDPRYADIKEFTSKEGDIYLFSSDHMTEAYAISLTDYYAELKE